MKDLNTYIDLYEKELLENVLPFWLNHSKDEVHGGYFTCLLRDGKVFDTDKFVWLQAREVWAFSHLYNHLEQRKEWLDMAIHGANFLKQYGRDDKGDWYFSLTKEGRPLVQPYNIFSDCFATMGFGQLYKATNKDSYGQIARETFENILKRQDNPKGQYNKRVPNARPLKNIDLPMILCGLYLEIEDLLDKDQGQAFVQNCIQEVMNTFYDEDSGLIIENVQPDGQLSDTFEGRIITPGTTFEAMWFIIDLAERLQDKTLIETATQRMLHMLEYSWDQEYGGFFYFMDRKGYPTQQLEWDQKLWWVHLEALVVSLKAYLHTKEEACWQWFERIHEYTWSHFSDPEYGEWFGYLNRRGEVLLPLKGGKWKGCYHVPRSLFQGWKTLRAITI